jgi:hypothetical protein
MWVENYLFLVGKLTAGSSARVPGSLNEALSSAQTLVLIIEELIKRSNND